MTETDPVSQTLCSFIFFRIPNDGQNKKNNYSDYFLLARVHFFGRLTDDKIVFTPVCL
jgi:hypothetical protein